MAVSPVYEINLPDIEQKSSLETFARDVRENISRTFTDKILRDLGRSATGHVRLTANPADTDTVTVTVAGAAVTYEFDNTSAVTAGNVAVPIGATAAASATNLQTALAAGSLVNPGFETGDFTGWTTVGTVGAGDSVTVDGTAPHSGSWAFKLVCASGNTLGKQQGITVLSDGSYLLSGWINVTARTAGFVNLDVQGTGIDTGGIQLATLTTGWTYFQESITIPTGTTVVNVRCFANVSPVLTAYFDDIALRRLGTTDQTLLLASAVHATDTATVDLAVKTQGFTFALAKVGANIVVQDNAEESSPALRYFYSLTRTVATADDTDRGRVRFDTRFTSILTYLYRIHTSATVGQEVAYLTTPTVTGGIIEFPTGSGLVTGNVIDLVVIGA